MGAGNRCKQETRGTEDEEGKDEDKLKKMTAKSQAAYQNKRPFKGAIGYGRVGEDVQKEVGFGWC